MHPEQLNRITVKNDFFNFAESKEKRSRGKHTSKKSRRGTDQEATQGTTSETEYEVDASARKAEEGRGDRRKVQGELHTSDEP